MPGLVSILDAGTNVEWHPIMQPMQCLSMDHGTLTFLSFVESLLLLLLVTYSWDGRTGQMEKEGKRDIGTGRQAGMGSKVRGGHLLLLLIPNPNIERFSHQTKWDTDAQDPPMNEEGTSPSALTASSLLRGLLRVTILDSRESPLTFSELWRVSDK